jgi:hypothetical protein
MAIPAVPLVMIGDVFGGSVAIGRHHVEHKALTCEMPIFDLVIFLCMLFFDVVKLLALVD